MSARAVSAKQFGALLDPEQQGFSVNIQTGESPKSGYMVAMKGSEATIPTSEIHPYDLESYVGRHVQHLDRPDRYFGGWNDPSRSQVDLDTSVNYPSSGGPTDRAAAHIAMIKHGQRSLYNVGTGGVEWNQYYGMSEPVAHQEISRQYEQAAGPHR
jgi:hypothetical protein